MTDGNQQPVEQQAFDAWGKRRLAAWRASGRARFQALTRRGFTGREMLDRPSLAHTGGRVYDPQTGRFLDADPHIQEAANSQSYNRYSYTLNNPLSYADPTGFFVNFLIKSARGPSQSIQKRFQGYCCGGELDRPQLAHH